MRRIAYTLVFGIALISVSACAAMPGGAGAAPKTGQTAGQAKPGANLAEVFPSIE